MLSITEKSSSSSMEPARQLPTSSVNITPGLSFLTKFVATGCFVGYVPWASGTFGSLVGLLIYLIPGVERAGILGFLIAIGMAAGVVTSAKVARAVGNQLSSSA